MSVNKVQLANGETIIDISDSTVTPETLAEGVTAHDASGQKITGTMPAGSGSVQSDWNQYDSSAADFIKNKTHYETKNVILEEQELAYDAEMGGMTAMVSGEISVGSAVAVLYDGNRYDTTTMIFPDTGVGFGNFGSLGLDDTGEPFVGVYRDGTVMIMPLEDEANHTVEIAIVEVSKLPGKYVDAQKVFYFSVLEQVYYIFTDMSLTTKATKQDIADAFSNYSVVICHINTGVASHYCAPLFVDIGLNEVAASIVCRWGDSGEVELYSAEYVPETTE